MREKGEAQGATNPASGTPIGNEDLDRVGDSGGRSGNPPSTGSRPWDPYCAGVVLTVGTTMPEKWLHLDSLMIF